MSRKLRRKNGRNLEAEATESEVMENSKRRYDKLRVRVTKRIRTRAIIATL